MNLIDLFERQIKTLEKSLSNVEEPLYLAQKLLECQLIGDPSLKRDYETIDLLYSSGYWYLPSLPHPVFISLLGLDDKSKENVSSLILEFMNQDNCNQLQIIIDNWNIEEFNEREIILKEALSAHREGKYVLSIPAIALQVEPIIKKWLSLSPSEYMSKAKKELKNILNESKDYQKDRIVIDERKSREMRYYLVTLRFINEIFFPFYESQKFENITNPFNRHVIGHGALEIEDHTQELSTKLILFLDKMHYLCEHFPEENDK